jgi:hypothetical protein
MVEQHNEMQCRDPACFIEKKASVLTVKQIELSQLPMMRPRHCTVVPTVLRGVLDQSSWIGVQKLLDYRHRLNLQTMM